MNATDLCIYPERDEVPLEDVRSASRTIEVLSNSFYRHCAREYWKITSLRIITSLSQGITFADIGKNEGVFAKLVYENMKIKQRKRVSDEFQTRLVVRELILCKT